MSSGLSQPPANFLTYNNQLSKQINVVVEIDGLPYFSNLQMGRNIEYGDNIVYGQTNIIYGGLVPVGINPGERQQKTLLLTDSGSFAIAQRLEPEQGRGSIGTLSLSFLDKDGYMTQAVSPGIVVPEILGQQVKIWIGYGPTSFPQDYYVVWRGRVGQVNANIGKITIQFVDPNVVRRQQVLYGGVTNLVGNLPAGPGSLVATYNFINLTWTCVAHGHVNGDLLQLSSTLTLPSGSFPATYDHHTLLWSTAENQVKVGDIYTWAGGTLPAGYNLSTNYYVVAVNPGPTTTFQLSATQGGSVVQATTTNGGGISMATGYFAGAFYFVIGVTDTTPDTFQLSLSPDGIPIQVVQNNGTGVITATFPDTIINVQVQDSFFQKIPQPGGGYDNTVRTFLKIDDEFIEYQQSGHEADGFQNGYFQNVVRGVSPVEDMSTPSVEAVHADTTEVDNYILINDKAINIALKLMLSGWGGPYLSDQVIYSLRTTDDVTYPTFTNGIVLPQNVDAVRDLGIAIGDYVTVSGDSTPANNVTCKVTGFNDLSNGQTNRVIITNKTFAVSDPSAATIAIRSQYDTWPTLAGCALPGYEVDVAGFQYYANTFLADPKYAYIFLLNGPETGKTFIESEILLPIGAYSITRQGKISMGYTKPPIADQRTVTLNQSNVMDPINIVVQRGINNRKYFNEVDWEFDCDESNSPTNQRNTINATSLAAIGVSSVLPISSRGARSSLNFLDIVSSIENRIFSRYANAGVLIDLKVNMGAGNQIEAGDIVLLNDNGQLQIPNFATGERNMGSQLMEVINRSLDLKSGETMLTLEGNTGFFPTDKFATIAPSSIILAGSTPSQLLITDSYGGVFPGNEQKKWTSYIGYKVTIHGPDWLVSGSSTILSVVATASIGVWAVNLMTALSFTPPVNFILDLAQYQIDTATDQALIKLLHGFSDPSVQVVSGSSSTVFSVSSGNIGRFLVGATILLRNVTYSIFSQEVLITSIVSNTITVSEPLTNTENNNATFIPDASMKIEIIGFADGGNAYRLA